MKALILVGGFGTRLRPLTLTLPKPMIEFANKPMILHQIEALANAGVTDIVLAVNYSPEAMVKASSAWEKEYNVKITFSEESEPLDTAGPLALAKPILGKDDSPFLVLNSDIICEYPFDQLIAAHKAHNKMGTICVTKVEEPSKYGVVVTEPNSTLIQSFVEKPANFVSNRINAGVYILNPSVLDLIELRPTSIEKEVFPNMVNKKELHCFDLEGFWMDVGQPKDFLAGTCLYLNYVASEKPAILDRDANVGDSTQIIEPCLIHHTAKIGPDCKIGPNVVVGPNVEIGAGVRMQRCVIMEHTRVKDHAWIHSAIVGWHSSVGRWSRLENVTVLGDDVTIKDEVYVNGGSILPHKSISGNIESPTIVM